MHTVYGNEKAADNHHGALQRLRVHYGCEAS